MITAISPLQLCQEYLMIKGDKIEETNFYKTYGKTKREMDKLVKRHKKQLNAKQYQN